MISTKAAPQSAPKHELNLHTGFSPLEPLTVAIRMAGRGLSANRLRAFLTMLGVIIGVGAVIIAIGIGEGSRAAVSESLQRLGTNVLTVMPGQQRRGAIGFGSGSRSVLTMDDATAIRQGAPSVAQVSPQVSGTAQIKYRNRNTSATVNGVSVAYPSVSNHAVQTGRFFSLSAVESMRREVVLGSSIATELFDKETPVGKAIRVGGHEFQVVGVLQAKGGQGFRNPDDGVYIPVTTAMRRVLGQDNLQNIVVQARSFGEMQQAQTEVEEILNRRHENKAGGEPLFRIFNQADLAESQNAQQDTFTSLITCLAIVSLGVGGIGIMNIMLVSVTERTREIGVRKAIGARRRDVLYQFLLEAMFLSLVGGLIGVAAGMIGSSLVASMNNWKVVVPMSSIVLSFGFSAIVGMFFGFYPALKASRLRPVQALRFE